MQYKRAPQYGDVKRGGRIKKKKVLFLFIPLLIVCIIALNFFSQGPYRVPDDPVSNQALNRRWIRKFFDFRFQGDEETYLYFLEEKNTYIAKIIMPEEIAEKFLRGEKRAEENILNELDEMIDLSILCTYFGEELFVQSGMSTINEDTFLIAGGKSEKLPRSACACMKRETMFIVLEPQDGVVVVFVIADHAKMNTSML